MTPSSPHRIRWGLIFAVWTTYGLLGAAQEHLSYASGVTSSTAETTDPSREAMQLIAVEV